MEPNPQPPLTLSPEDAAAVDALLDAHGIAPASPRAARVQQWLNTLSSAPVPQAPTDLAERTLARIRMDRMKLPKAHSAAAVAEPAPHRPSPFRYLREIATMAVAASILGIVVILGVGQARQSGKRVACAANLMSLSTAFASYASVNQEQLPVLGMPMDQNWMDTNRIIPAVPLHAPLNRTHHTQGVYAAMAELRTNSTNMMPLIKATLIRPANLICAGRTINAAAPTPDGILGYSYVDMCTLERPKWDGDHKTIVLGDRNPLFDPEGTLDPLTNSANHAGLGNYLVRADGSTTWETSPNVGPNHDNIWTIGPGPHYRTIYTGTEKPTSPDDVFLCP